MSARANLSGYIIQDTINVKGSLIACLSSELLWTDQEVAKATQGN